MFGGGFLGIFFFFSPFLQVFILGVVFDKLNDAIFHRKCTFLALQEGLKDKFSNFPAFVIGMCLWRLSFAFGGMSRKGF